MTETIKKQAFLISIGSAIGVCLFISGITYNTAKWKFEQEYKIEKLQAKQIAFENRTISEGKEMQDDLAFFEDMMVALFRELDIPIPEKKTS